MRKTAFVRHCASKCLPRHFMSLVHSPRILPPRRLAKLQPLAERHQRADDPRGQIQRPQATPLNSAPSSNYKPSPNWQREKEHRIYKMFSRISAQKVECSNTGVTLSHLLMRNRDTDPVSQDLPNPPSIFMLQQRHDVCYPDELNSRFSCGHHMTQVKLVLSGDRLVRDSIRYI